MREPTDSSIVARMRWLRLALGTYRAQCGFRDVVDVLVNVPWQRRMARKNASLGVNERRWMLLCRVIHPAWRSVVTDAVTCVRCFAGLCVGDLWSAKHVVPYSVVLLEFAGSRETVGSKTYRRQSPAWKNCLIRFRRTCRRLTGHSEICVAVLTTRESCVSGSAPLSRARLGWATCCSWWIPCPRLVFHRNLSRG